MYGLALEDVVGALAQDTIAVTDRERSDMLALARTMKMDELVSCALGFCPVMPAAALPAGPAT